MDCTKIMVSRSDQLTVIQSDQRTASLINNFYRIEILESISVHVYQNPIMFQWKATPPDLAFPYRGHWNNYYKQNSPYMENEDYVQNW